MQAPHKYLWVPRYPEGSLKPLPQLSREGHWPRPDRLVGEGRGLGALLLLSRDSELVLHPCASVSLSVNWVSLGSMPWACSG